jgi:DNA polymerase-3 subunit delta
MRIVLLAGREPYLVREYTRQVVEVLEEAFGEVEQFRFDGTEVDLATVLDELRSYGLLQQHKLVVLDRADQFLSGRERWRRSLETYAHEPLEHATLLMRAETWRPGRLDKLIAACGLVQRVEPVTEATAVRWCVARTQRRYAGTLEDEAAEALVARIGTDLERLDAELSKLASFVDPDQPITRGDVLLLVGLSREQQAWIIQSVLARGDAGEVLSTLRELLTVSRQPEQLLTWAITDQIARLHAASRLVERGEHPAAVAKTLKLWGETREDILHLARDLGPGPLAQLLRAAIETDWRNKRGYGESTRSLEALAVTVTKTLRGADHAHRSRR